MAFHSEKNLKFTFSLRWAPWSEWNDDVVFCSLLQTSPFMNGWVGSKSMVFTIEPMGNTSQEIYNATLDMLLQQVYKARIGNYVSNFTKSSSFSIFQLRQHFPYLYPILCQITNHCFDSWYSVPIAITIFLANQDLINWPLFQVKQLWNVKLNPKIITFRAILDFGKFLNYLSNFPLLKSERKLAQTKISSQGMFFGQDIFVWAMQK